MRRVSLNARLAADRQSTDDVFVHLIVIEHPQLNAPIRLSTDNTERLSVEPLAYCTRSTWRGADPINDPYLYIIASTELPGDEEGVPPTAAIILDNVSSEIGKTLRSFTTPATVHMAVVMASTPDVIEEEFPEFLTVQSGGNASEVRLELSRRMIEEETWPQHRFTRARFPGLLQ